MRLFGLLRNLRLSKNLTQGELAHILGIRRNYVYMIETGRAWPGKQLLRRYCDYCGFNYHVMLKMIADERVELYRKRVYIKYGILS